MAGPDAVVAMRTRAAAAQESSLMVAEGTLTGQLPPPASAGSAVVPHGDGPPQLLLLSLSIECLASVEHGDRP